MGIEQIDPVVLEFAAAGLPAVERAYDTVEKRVQRFSSKVETEERRAEKAYERLAREADRAIAQMTKAQERESNKRQALQDKAEKQTIRSLDREAAEVRRIEQAKLREVERAEEYKMRLRIRSSEAAGRVAVREAREEQAIREKTNRTWQARGRSVGGSVVGSLGRLIGGAGAVAGATLGIGGAMAVADAAKSEFAAQKQAALLINLTSSGGKAAPGATQGAILGQAGALSKELGIDKGQLLEGAVTYSKNARGGDFGGAMANMGFFAKLSAVTGADINKIGEAAGVLQSQNPNLDSKGMQELLVKAEAMSHAGSMSFSDAASQIGMLGSTRAFYKGDVGKNQSSLIALGQIARAGGDVGEVGTFVKDIATEAGTAQRKFKKETGRDLLHIDSKTGQLDDPLSVIEQVFRSTHGNINTIGHVFGQRGSKLFTELAGSYQEASTKAGGGKAGEEAGVKAVMANVRGVSDTTGSVEDINKRFAETNESAARKFEIAVNRIKESLEESLGPHLDRLAEKMPQIVDAAESLIKGVSTVAEFLEENPIKGIGAVVLAAITKDLADAAIVAGVKAAITAAISGAMGGGVGNGGGALGGAGAGAATVGAGVLLAAGAAVVAPAAVAVLGGQVAELDQQRQNFSGTAGALNTASKLRHGKVTAADIAAAEKQAAGLRGQIADAEAGATTTDPMSGATTTSSNVSTKATSDALTILNDAIAQATIKLQKMTTVAANVDPNAAARNVPIQQRHDK